MSPTRRAIIIVGQFAHVSGALVYDIFKGIDTMHQLLGRLSPIRIYSVFAR